MSTQDIEVIMSSDLYLAIQERHTEIVRLLLDRGADPNQVNHDEDTPLHEAVLEGHTEIVQLLLDRGADLNLADKYGATPLNQAASLGRTRIVQLLLEHDADLNLADKYGATPLHAAALARHNKIVQLLLDYNSDPNQVDRDGDTPLHKAAQQGHTKIVRLLLDHDADLNLMNRDGDTPLHKAALEGHTKLVQLLLDHDADLNLTDKYGATPLHKAASEGYTEIVQLLLDHDADLKLADKYGATPLHKAASEGYTEIVRLLLDRGANPNRADQNGQTPLQILSSAEGSDSMNTSLITAFVIAGLYPQTIANQDIKHRAISIQTHLSQAVHAIMSRFKIPITEDTPKSITQAMRILRLIKYLPHYHQLHRYTPEEQHALQYLGYLPAFQEKKSLKNNPMVEIGAILHRRLPTEIVLHIISALTNPMEHVQQIQARISEVYREITTTLYHRWVASHHSLRELVERLHTHDWEHSYQSNLSTTLTILVKPRP